MKYILYVLFSYMWLSLQLRTGDSKSITEIGKEFGAKSVARGMEAEFSEIQIQIFERQHVKGAQVKRFRIAIHNMEPVQVLLFGLQKPVCDQNRPVQRQTLEASGMNDGIFVENQMELIVPCLLRPNLAEVALESPGTMALGMALFAELTPHTDRAGEYVFASRSQKKIVWCKPQNHGIIGTNRMVRQAKKRVRKRYHSGKLSRQNM